MLSRQLCQPAGTAETALRARLWCALDIGRLEAADTAISPVPLVRALPMQSDSNTRSAADLPPRPRAWHERVCEAAAKGCVDELKRLLLNEGSGRLKYVSVKYTAPPLGCAVLHGRLEAGMPPQCCKAITVVSVQHVSSSHMLNRNARRKEILRVGIELSGSAHSSRPAHSFNTCCCLKGANSQSHLSKAACSMILVFSRNDMKMDY